MKISYWVNSSLVLLINVITLKPLQIKSKCAMIESNPQTYTRTPYEVTFQSIFVVYLSQIISHIGSLAKRGSEGMGEGRGKEDDFCRLWEGCQQGKLPPIGLASVYKGQ